MTFFKKIFSCTCAEPIQTAPAVLPRGSCQKMSKPSIDIACSPIPIQNCKTTMSTQPHQNSSPKVFKKMLPSFRFISSCNKAQSEEKDVDFGFLVGVVSMREGVNKKLIAKDSMRIKIGKNNQIVNLLSLRPRSVDTLVVFWTHIGCQFSLMQLLIVDQRLVLVCSQWQAVVSLLKNMQEQIFGLLGQSALKDSLNRLFFEIVQKQSYYLVCFCEQEAEGYIREQIQDIIEIQIEEECLPLLLSKMTLQEYTNLKKKQDFQKRKVIQYLNDIQNQMKTIKLRSSKDNPTSAFNKSNRLSSHQSKVLGGKSDRQARVSELNEEEIKYFTSKMNFSPSPHFQNRIEGDLDIFNYNFEETVSPFEESYLRKQNLASPSRNARKIRTRSQEISGAQSTPYYDDEIFDKYK